MDVAGKRAIVTGAAAGTGRAIALRLATEGADVVVADVDRAGGEDTVAAIARGGGRARFVRADLRAAETTGSAAASWCCGAASRRACSRRSSRALSRG